MIESPSTASSSEQARLELAVAAGSAERANRPRGLIYLGVLAVAAGTIALFMSFGARSAASDKLVEQQNRLKRIVESRDEIARVSKALDSRGVTPDTRIASRLEALAAAVNLELAGPVSDADDMTATMTGAVRKVYTAQVRVGEDPTDVLRWLATVQNDESTRNLEITQLKISQVGGTSGKGGQTSTEVRFARWEKREARR